MSELGNLMAGILLSPRRMSTVKIRARSLFCTTVSRSRAGGAGFGLGGYVENGKRLLARNNRGTVFLSSPQPPAAVHSLYTSILNFTLAGIGRAGAESDYRI